MKISQLIDRLNELRFAHGDIEVALVDGFNGGGDPRTINYGPVAKDIAKDGRDDLDDIETQDGMVVLMGYGCY